MAILLLKKSYRHKDLKEIKFHDLWNSYGVFTTMRVLGRPAKILFFKHFKNLLYPILLALTPLLVLFAMMGDWGRIVKISYTFTVLFYFYLLQNNLV